MHDLLKQQWERHGSMVYGEDHGPGTAPFLLDATTPELAEAIVVAHNAAHVEWTAEDEAAANAEGWCISNANAQETAFEIQRVDEHSVFTGDGTAIAHVYWMAGSGSALHRKAIEYTLQPGREWVYAPRLLEVVDK